VFSGRPAAGLEALPGYCVQHVCTSCSTALTTLYDARLMSAVCLEAPKQTPNGRHGMEGVHMYTHYRTGYITGGPTLVWPRFLGRAGAGPELCTGTNLGGAVHWPYATFSCLLNPAALSAPC
jgi:hypothetical protein